MASSFTEIANFALNRIGIADAITDLSDQTARAKTCARWMAQARDEVLRDFPWPFASRAEALALVAGESFPGWLYVYRYPQNAARIVQVADENGIRATIRYGSNRVYGDPQFVDYLGLIAQQAPFTQALSDDGASRLILSDVPNAWVYYTATVTNPGVYPADFVSVLAWKLAAEIGGPLKADTALVTRAQQTYEFMKRTGQATAANEQTKDRPQESPSVQARY